MNATHYLTFNTVVRVNQIEVARDRDEGHCYQIKA